MSSISLTPLTIQRNVYLSSSLFLMVEPSGSLKDADCIKKHLEVLHFAYKDEEIKLMTHRKLKLKKCVYCAIWGLI